MFVTIYESWMGKKTLVLGASENTQRYAAQAVKLLLEYDHEVVALGRKPGEIYGIPIQGKARAFKDVHTITLYINPKIQQAYFHYLVSLNSNRVIFNPGTENIELINFLKENNIQVEIACTLVMLRTKQY